MNAQTKLILIRGAAAVLASALLASCHGVFSNENDWAMKKGAQPVYVPLQVSKKVYR